MKLEFGERGGSACWNRFLFEKSGSAWPVEDVEWHGRLIGTAIALGTAHLGIFCRVIARASFSARTLKAERKCSGNCGQSAANSRPTGVRPGELTHGRARLSGGLQKLDRGRFADMGLWIRSRVLDRSVTYGFNSIPSAPPHRPLEGSDRTGEAALAFGVRTQDMAR
jgi:hypothetical protein